MTGPESVLPDLPSRHRLSAALADLGNDPSDNAISVAEICAAMGDRAFGALLFVFAAPGVLSISVPGVSAVLGTPLLFLAVQMMLGRDAPWLPRLIGQRTVQRRSLARATDRVVPWVRRAERVLRPRLGGLAGGPFQRLVGLVCAVLATVMILPIPFGNMPPALAICILSLGLLEADGLVVLAGLAVSAAALVIAGGVLLSFAKALSLILRHLLGT